MVIDNGVTISIAIKLLKIYIEVSIKLSTIHNREVTVQHVIEKVIITVN